MKTVTADLADRLAMLYTRYCTAYQDLAPLRSPTEDQYLMMAETFAAGLYAASPDVVARTRALVDPAELADQTAAGFWSTPLGRVLFAAGGFAEAALSRTLAAGVLDCSRQWIHELVVRGDLQAAPSQSGTDRYVYAAKVRTLLIKRLDASVK